MKAKHWKCPACGYLMNDTCYKQAAVDFDCRCRDKKLSNYYSVELEVEDREPSKGLNDDKRNKHRGVQKN